MRTRTSTGRSPGRTAKVIGLAAAAATAATLGVAIPASAATAPDAAPQSTAVNGKSGPTSVAYVEVNNDDLSNVGRYSLADGSPAFDVAIIFAANIDYNGSAATLSLNDRVQATLDDAANQIRPLQARGIKVELSILGNHQGAGFANFGSADAAAAFAGQVADVANRYGLDGVDLDDEYAEYGKNGTAQPNAQSIGWLITALRNDLPGKTLSFYNIGPSADTLSASDPSIGAKLDYAWNPYYGTYSAPNIPGLDRSHLSAAAVNIQETSADTAASLARSTVADGYGVFMTYALPGGDQSAFVSSFTNPLYGQNATFQ